MQTDLDRKLSDKITYGGGRVVFVFCFLFSLIPIRETVSSTTGPQVIFEVIFTWIILVLAGTTIWQSASKQRLDRLTAGVVLIEIGMAALMGFSAIAVLATHR